MKTNTLVHSKNITRTAALLAGTLGVYTAGIHKSNNMSDMILNKLDEIEKKNNIKIIYACEVGSKAWGSDSKDSDYDIRYIYVSPRSHYLNEMHKDTAKDEFNDDFDIYGYDLSKMITLLKEGKPQGFEWLNSPVKYLETDFSEELKKIAKSNYNSKDLQNHYTNYANNNYSKYIAKREQVDIKSYLSVIKAILSAQHIKTFNTVPPLTYRELFTERYCDGKDLLIILNSLLQQKKSGTKIKTMEHVSVLDKFIEDSIKELNTESIIQSHIANENIYNSFFNETINSSYFADINKTELSEIEQKRLGAFKEDIDYKKQLLECMGMPLDEHLALRSIVGPQEFEYILRKYNDTPEIYSTGAFADNNGNVKLQNVIEGKFKANLHIHTIYSDGKMSVQEILDSAAKYADKIAKKSEKDKSGDFEPFTIAITDHNTTEGCKEAVKIIHNNPEKYKNLRVVLGIELSATENEINGYIPKKPYQIHLLAQNINPFDSELNDNLKKLKNSDNPNYNSLGNIKSVIHLLDSQPYVTLGYAHPLEGHSYKKIPTKDQLIVVIKDLIRIFVDNSNKRKCYIENYYQSYNNDIGKNEDLKHVIKEYSDNIGLLSSGGLDSHGTSIFFE